MFTPVDDKLLVPSYWFPCGQNWQQQKPKNITRCWNPPVSTGKFGSSVSLDLNDMCQWQNISYHDLANGSILDSLNINQPLSQKGQVVVSSTAKYNRFEIWVSIFQDQPDQLIILFSLFTFNLVSHNYFQQYLLSFIKASSMHRVQKFNTSRYQLVWYVWPNFKSWLSCLIFRIVHHDHKLQQQIPMLQILQLQLKIWFNLWLQHHHLKSSTYLL
jgi:hypothetical protein